MDDMQAHKMDKFTRSVNMEVGEHINKIVEAAKDQSEKRLKRAEDKALEEAFNRIQKSVREIESKYRRMLALAEQKCRMDALRHREELSKAIFDDVERELMLFTESDKYEEYLIRLVSAEELSEDAVIFLSQNDQRYAENLRKVSGREVRIDQGIKLGGLSITDSVQGFIIDKTLDGSLEDQKKSFSSKYSFKYEG
jgi:vacuolar-type H+-ATPase subunit E/Vma4